MSKPAKPPVPKVEETQSDQGINRLQPFAIQPIERVTLPEPGVVGSRCPEQAFLHVERGVLEDVLDGPEPEHPKQRPEDGGKLLAVFDRRVSGGGPADSRPKKRLEEGGQETIHLRGKLAGFGVSGRMHIGDGAAKPPAERAEECEVRHTLPPVLAPGHECRRHPGQGPRDHRAVFVPVVAPDAPSDRQGEHDQQDRRKPERGRLHSGAPLVSSFAIMSTTMRPARLSSSPNIGLGHSSKAASSSGRDASPRRPLPPKHGRFGETPLLALNRELDAALAFVK